MKVMNDLVSFILVSFNIKSNAERIFKKLQ